MPVILVIQQVLILLKKKGHYFLQFKNVLNSWISWKLYQFLHCVVQIWNICAIQLTSIYLSNRRYTHLAVLWPFERFLASEVIREKIMRQQLGEELPYDLTVQIESFKTEPALNEKTGRMKAACTYIDATIFVDQFLDKKPSWLVKKVLSWKKSGWMPMIWKKWSNRRSCWHCG